MPVITLEEVKLTKEQRLNLTMKKILLVDASPRKNGNSEVIVDRLAAELKDAEVMVFKIREKKVNPCLACGTCQGKDAPKCVQNDDMSALIAEIETCDAIALAAPIYFNQVNAQAKMIIDRLYCFFNVERPFMSNTAKRGKKAALVCSFWGGPADVYAKYAEETVGNFSYMGADHTKAVIFGDIKEPGSIRNKEKYLEDISALAQWLAE